MISQALTRWVGCTALGVCAASPLFAADRDVLNDLSARIQFEFYAADARALQRDLETLKTFKAAESETTLRSYYLAYGHMKLAEVLAEKDRPTARKSTGECRHYAEEVTDREPKRVNAKERARLDTLYAELWAIQAACISLDAEISYLPVPALSDNRARQKAAALAPGNPRVQLLAAIEASKQADNSQEHGAAIHDLVAVTTLFDTLPPPEGGMPDWGYAEALAWLGQSYLLLGDRIGARNALERALVLAPDFVWARTLQQQLRASP
jgi:tetratricopeptide (TPR) repeat protein